MKKLLLLLALCPAFAFAQNYASQNVTFLGNWNNNPAQQAEPVYGIKYQGVFGWRDTTNNREYGIIGTSTGTQFVDVTVPTNPVPVDYIPAVHGNLIWHEIQVYDHYAYIVSDDGGGNSFIIADLQYLPDSVHVVHNGTSIFEMCHTVFIDGDKLYGGSVTGVNGSFYYSMAVYSLADPESPTLIRTLNQDYSTPGTVHDMFVRNDTVYASGGFDGLYIFKFNDGTTNDFTQLGTLTQYPEQGYNHSSSLTADGSTLIFMDEVPDGRGIKSIDVSNLGNITVNQVFRSNQGNTPHNPYVIGNDYLIGANYTDGLQIFNISNPSNCVRVGYFDTDTLINFPNYTQAYHGAWGAFMLPSGVLLVSDMQNGLYAFDISVAISSVGTTGPLPIGVNAYPNPFNADFFINTMLDRAQVIRYSVYDNAGRLVLQGSETMPAGPALLEVPAESLAKGMYSVRIEGDAISCTSRLVKAE